jgi:hypothetical protein
VAECLPKILVVSPNPLSRRVQQAPSPTVELSTKRARSLPAARNFPCKASLIMTVVVRRFAKKLLTPVRMGCGTTRT